MNEHGYHDEMPLPTYEEVVGASNHNIGFKDEVLLQPRPANAACQANSELVGECVGVPTGENRSATLRRLVRCKQWAKKYLPALVGVIITPLFFLFIILQLKSCGTCKHLKEEDREFLSKLDNCDAKMMEISGRYTKIYNDLQYVRKERDELLINKEIADAEMEKLHHQYKIATSDMTDLRDQLTVLKKELEKYKILVKVLSNDITASPKTTLETTTGMTTEKSTKGYEDFPLPPHPNVITLDSIQKMIDYLKSRSNSDDSSISKVQKALQIFSGTL